MKNHKQQLRVGNILHHIGLGTCKVLGIHNDGNIHICDINNNKKQHLVLDQFTHRLEEIPLSEDWLLKAGFKQNENKLFGLKIFRKGIYFVSLSDKSNMFGFKQNSNEQYTPIKNSQFVHKLQNIYFELEDKELIFSEA